MSSLTRWLPLDVAGRLKCLRRGALNVGNARQNLANLRTLALAQIAAPSNPPWAKYSTAANEPRRVMVWPSRVPGFQKPIAS